MKWTAKCLAFLTHAAAQRAIMMNKSALTSSQHDLSASGLGNLYKSYSAFKLENKVHKNVERRSSRYVFFGGGGQANNKHEQALVLCLIRSHAFYHRYVTEGSSLNRRHELRKTFIEFSFS